MRNPLTRVLVRIMAKGFYREHTGLLLSLFVLIFINFFYTNVLNQTHLTPSEIVQNALKLVISTVSEPLGVIILFAVFFIYNVKSRQYISRRLKETDVQFLFYSSNALSWKQQVQAWTIVQFVVSIPIVVLGAYAITIGFVFGHWVVPLLIPSYLLLLNFSNASYYTKLLNNVVSTPDRLVELNWLKKMPKPISTLFLYEIIVNKRVAYIIAKLASLVSIVLIFSVFPESHADIRLLGIIGLCIALVHAILIYQASEFESFYLRFIRNLPYNQWQLYCQQAAMYSIVLLPEFVWLLVAGKFGKGIIVVCLTLSLVLLFRALIYWLGHRMKLYLRLIFGLFILFLLMNLFGFVELLIVVNVLAAWVLIIKCKYRSYE